MDFHFLGTNIPFTTYSLGKGKKRINYINIDFNCDIETTSTRIKGEKVAWCYHWQIGFNNQVYAGRNLKDIVSVFDKINEWCGNNNARIICLVHNFAYEFHFLNEYIDFQDIFATAPNKPIKARYYNIEFRCSYAFSNMSLKLLAKTYTDVEKKVGELDYNVIRYPSTPLTNEEKEYCFFDCFILSQYWWKHIVPNYIQVKKPWLPLTNTAKVRQDMRRRITNWNKYKAVYSSVYPTEEIYKKLNLCFYGGIVRANAKHTGRVLKKIASRDRTSSYPAVQFHYKFPLTKWTKIDISQLDDYSNDYEYAKMYRIIFKNIKSTKPFSIMPINKCLHISSDRILDNGRLYSTSLIELWVTEIDLFYYKKFYKGEMKIEEIYISKKYRLPKFQVLSLYDYYCGKNKLKGVAGMEEEYMKSKNMLNSNFGCCVQKHNDFEHKFVNNEWVKEVKEYEEGSTEFLLYQVGVWITAYARGELLRACLDLINDGGTPIYMDTDSIKYYYDKGKHEHIFDKIDTHLKEKTKDACEYFNLDFSILEKIGTWDLETKGFNTWEVDGFIIKQKRYTYKSFSTLGSKRYIHDGKPTISGLPIQAWYDYCNTNNITSEQAFRNGLKIPPKLAHKLCMTYVTNGNPHVIKYNENGVDYEFTTPTHYIHAENIGFELKQGKDYIKFIQFIREQTGERSNIY